LLLLSGRFVTLAVAVLAPIVINIVGFHLFLAPSGIALALAVLAAELYLAWTYRAAFAPMLQARAPLPQKSAVAAPEPARVIA
jgi:putative oxidoreductase